MSTLPMNTDEYGQPVMQDISQQRAFAQLLREQANTDLQGQNVSGIYVAPSWTQQLARVLKGYVAGQTDKNATEQQNAYDDKRMGYAKKLAAALNPREVSTPNDYNDNGNQPMLPSTSMQDPTPQDITSAVNDYYVNTGNSDAIAKNALSKIPKPDEYDTTHGFDGQNRAYVTSKNGTVKILDGISQAPSLEIAPNGMTFNKNDIGNIGKDMGKPEIVNGQVIGTPSQLKTGQVIPLQDDPNKPFHPNTGLPNKPYQEYTNRNAKLGSSTVNNTVSIAGPENKYNGKIGEGLAQESLDLVNIAKSAPEVINNARMIRTALDKGAITGTGAEARLAVQKAAETLGIVEPGKAATTQQLMSGLAKITLSGVKTSGLGAGNGFTDKDRDFLSSAISGTIADTPANLRRVADISERVATSNHQRGKKVLERWKSDPALKNVAQDYDIPDVPNNGPTVSNF